MSRKAFWLFAVLALIQLAVPLYMIQRWENVLANGQRYRWLTDPVDPYDLLRGRYVDIRVRDPQGPLAEGAQLKSGQKAYALLDRDQEGFAVIRSVSDRRPAGNDYVQAKVRWIEKNTIVHVALPFRRFYMREDLAPAAERAYQEQAGKNGVVLVRVKDGFGVIEELYIGKQTIYEYLLSPADIPDDHIPRFISN